MNPDILLTIIGALGMGGFAGAFVAFKKLPSDIESISVTAAQGAVAAQAAVIERQGELIEHQADRIDVLEEENEKLRRRVRHVEQVLADHGWNGH